MENEIIRAAIKNSFFGFFGAIRTYRQYRHKNKIKPIVLTYHGVIPKIPSDKPEYEYRNFVTAAKFEKQIRFMLRHYRPMRIDEFFSQDSIAHRSFLITFDDGFRNNLAYAIPILKKYDLQACIFITTGLIGTRQLLWTEQVTYLLYRTQQKKLEVHCKSPMLFHLQTKNDREKASIEIRKLMKKLPADQAKDILREIQSELSDVSIQIRPEEEDRYLFMNWDDVRKVISSGQVIGSHTHTHPMLSMITPEESYKELEISKELIEKKIGMPCEAFSYPNGEAENFADSHRKQLDQLGYRCAFSQISPFTNFNTDRFALPRINMTMKMSMPIFEAKLCGFKRA